MVLFPELRSVSGHRFIFLIAGRQAAQINRKQCRLSDKEFADANNRTPPSYICAGIISMGLISGFSMFALKVTSSLALVSSNGTVAT